MTRSQWPLFHPTEGGEVFCVKGSWVLSEAAVGKETLRRGARSWERPRRKALGGQQCLTMDGQ